jgi:hypothetical protein
VRKIQDHDAKDNANIKLLVELGDGEFDEIIVYGTLCKCFEDLEDENLTSDHKVCIFTDVIGHQGPLRKSHKYWISLHRLLIMTNLVPWMENTQRNCHIMAPQTASSW